MNKRAKQRLIGVTAIIVIIVAAILVGTGRGAGAGALKSSVADVAADDTLIGQQVQVSGPVVAGSWVPGADPFEFEIRDQGETSGPTLKVVWNKAVPSAFGDGTVAIVTGVVQDDGSIVADKLITQCPSKYESATGALSVADAIAKKEEIHGNPVKVTGYVVEGTIVAAGEGERFSVADTAEGGETLGIAFTGSLPAGMEDGSKVVIQGRFTDGVFTADEVSLDADQ